MKSINENVIRKNLAFFISVVLIVVCLCPNLIYPQEPDVDNFDNQTKWILSFYLATTFGGPSTDIEDVMRTSGFDDHSYGLFSSETNDHPKSKYEGLPWMIEAQYRMNKSVSLGFQISNSILRETVGYGNPQGGFGSYLFLNYSAKTLAPIISFYLNENIILGIGPSYNTLVSYESDVGVETMSVIEEKIGLLTHITFKINCSRLFSGNIIFQYRFIGSTTIGPFIKENTIGYANPIPSTVIITFPRTEINYNHLFIGFGMGIHF